MELRGVGDPGVARAVAARAVAARPSVRAEGLLGAHNVVLLLLALTALRLAVAAVTPLAPDEAYYWVWSRALAPGYLDAPPMVALWIRAGTALAGQTELGVRLLGPFAALIGSALLWDAAERLFPGRRAGPAAAALMNATLLFGAGAVLMTPDTPLLLFWTACLWALARFAAGPRGGWLILAGLFAGLGFDSKYTAVLLVPAVLLWLLLIPDLRRWLWRPASWLGALCGMAVIAPVLWWNATHGWVSFAKQGGRVGDFRPDNALRFLGELALGQAGLATPLIFVLCVAGGVAALRLGLRRREPGWALLALLAAIPAALFVEHAFGDRVQANWPAVLYPAAVIAAAGLAGRFWVYLRAPATGLGLAVTLTVYAQAAWGVLPVPARLDPTALQLRGWKALAAEVQAARRRTGAAFVAAEEYGVAARLAWTLPRDVRVIAVGPRWALFGLPRPAPADDPGLLVRSERRAGSRVTAPWAVVRPVGEAGRMAPDGTVVARYRLLTVIGSGRTEAAAVLPRR